MGIASLAFGTADAAGRRKKAIWILVTWTVVVLVLVARHVFWRDEVRALSLALQGDNVFGMLRGLHGEGHPGIWYLLLRGAHALVPTEAVLPAVSFVVALAAAALLLFRSPFSLPLVVLFLVGRAPIFEYSVMARNYGISMLLMFAIAALYRSRRDRGVLLGVLLFLLANCNVHSVLLAAAFMLFWFIDVTRDKSAQRSVALRHFALNAAIVALGIALCVVTVYPPVNDAAQIDRAGGVTFSLLARAAVWPSVSVNELVGGYTVVNKLLDSMSRSQQLTVVHAWMSAVLFGSTLGLVRRPGALAATWVALMGLSGFFTIIYSGSYRHQALWLVFLMCMYWITGPDETPQRATTAARIARTFGLALFGVLLAYQACDGLTTVVRRELGRAPESRSRDLARLIVRSPELANATVIADPDFLVEPLSYYMPNRTYLLRERRFGNVVVFTRNARLTLDLNDILSEARYLRETTRQPVVILLGERLDPSAPARTIKEGYNWQLSSTPQHVQSFLSSTRRIERFPPACCSDESFDVYVLD